MGRVPQLSIDDQHHFWLDSKRQTRLAASSRLDRGTYLAPGITKEKQLRHHRKV
jgi:hypothetical protein